MRVFKHTGMQDRGVKQGSPWLFSVYMYNIMKVKVGDGDNGSEIFRGKGENGDSLTSCTLVCK